MWLNWQGVRHAGSRTRVLVPYEPNRLVTEVIRNTFIRI